MTPADQRDGSDQVPNLPSLPGLDGLGLGKPKPLTGESGVQPELEDDSRNMPAIVIPKRKTGEDSAVQESVEESDVLRGRNFGGYELVQKIGQGGMGLVYRANQVSLDRQVAIKILSKALSENNEFIKRFEREAKSIGRISHTNLVAVYDFGRFEGLYYMVTEFVEGTNLAKLINEKLVIPAEELLPLMVHCLNGLAHVSQHHIVHRDIKPDNILITKDGIAKIADFGLAKDVSNDTDLTAVGLAMGTPAYMSPEQCMGRKLDVRSDLYSLGVTAYFALTGEKPFTGQSSFEIMTKQREHMPPPPAQLNPRLPKDISNLVMRMIAKDPHDRYRDAVECRDAWVEVGQRIGIMPAVSRSGEYQFSAAELAKLSGASAPAPATDLPTLAPMPPSPVPSAPSAASAASAASSSTTAPPPIPLNDPPPSASSADSARVPTDRVADRDRRGGTERRLARGTSGAEPITCGKCGMLNRPTAKRCQRCDTPFDGEPVQSVDELEREAQRCFDQGSFAAAAVKYSQAADRTEDRRLRAVLRSREREARMREAQDGVSEVVSRSRAMVDRGDLRGGIDLLERHLGGLRGNSAASGAEMEGPLIGEIARLRGRMGSRRRLRTLLVILIVLGAIVGAGWILWKNGTLARLAGIKAPVSSGATP